MSAYRQTDYRAILEGVQQARSWYEQLGISTSDSRIEELDQVLGEFTRDLETLPAAEIVERWDWRNDQRAYYALSDGAAFGNIHKQLQYLPSHQLPRNELKRALRGPLCPIEEEPSTTEGRNIFLELDIASKLLEVGIEVTGWDDVRFTFNGVKFVVQCKRPFRPTGVLRNIRKAWDQIETRAPKGSFVRGLIAVGVDKIFGLDEERPAPIINETDLENRVRSLSEQFLLKFSDDWQELFDDRLVGLILMYRFLCHTLPTNTISAVSYDAIIPTARPGTKDYFRLREFGVRLRR